MEDHKRLDELRRRVEKDPASVAFASLAEELRKAGQYDEAVRVCRTGLERHPTYLAAHVTLGRALIGLQQYSEARTELERVLQQAPDNLLAQKALNELKERGGDAVAAPPEPAPAPEPARLNLRVEAAAPEPAPVEPPSVADVAPEPAKAGPHVPEVAAPPEVAPPNGGPPPEHPAIGELEEWQARIQADRAQRHR